MYTYTLGDSPEALRRATGERHRIKTPSGGREGHFGACKRHLYPNTKQPPPTSVHQRYLVSGKAVQRRRA